MPLIKKYHLLQWVRICAISFALAGVCGGAHATKFSTFQLYTGVQGDDLGVKDDAYPGKIAFINHRNESVCVNFQILDAQNQVLRYSKIRFHIPPKRTDLALTGPGDMAKVIKMAIQTGASSPCGPSSWLGEQLSISPGSSSDVSWQKFKFDASTWNGKSRDILIEIKP